MTRRKKYVAAGAVLVASVGVAATAGTSSSAVAGAGTSAASTASAPTVVHTDARLRALNNSGVFGSASVAVRGRRLHVRVDAQRLLRDMPHAQHIHFGAQARHECPTVRDDDNADHRLNTAEGLPAYGDVRVSLTKRGDTSPESALAVTRFPTAPNGRIAYDRAGIWTQREVARAIRQGEAVVVVHGIDYNQNGTYDFRGAGRSELDPSLPAEATDPVVCGVLRTR